MRVSLSLVHCLVALTVAKEEARTVLGPVVHTQGAVHELNRTSLLQELQERQAPHSAEADSDDVLRIKLYDARARLLEHRNQHVMHAQTVMNEVTTHSSSTILADWSVDTLLTDDNAIFAETLSRALLWDLKIKTAGGALVGLALAHYAPLGRISPAMLPASLRLPSASKAFAICAVTSVLMGLLQFARHNVLRLVGAPSYFGQKITAVCCREGVFEWVQAMEDARAAHAATPSGSTSDVGGGAGDAPPLFRRAGVFVPILLLATGSSIFEEVAFRGIFMHGLITKLRLGPRLAMALRWVLPISRTHKALPTYPYPIVLLACASRARHPAHVPCLPATLPRLAGGMFGAESTNKRGHISTVVPRSLCHRPSNPARPCFNAPCALLITAVPHTVAAHTGPHTLGLQSSARRATHPHTYFMRVSLCVSLDLSSRRATALQSSVLRTLPTRRAACIR